MMRPGWKAWGWTAAGAAAAAAVVWTLQAPVRVGVVEVTGTQRMARSEVARLVNVKPGQLLTHDQASALESSLGRLPAFLRVTVTRGFTGTLHVRVVERVPALWMLRARCALAADGRLLPHFASREAGLVAVDGLPVARGQVTDLGALNEALDLARRLGRIGVGDPGCIRRLGGGGWEWNAGGKRIRLSGPPSDAELARLRRFREAFPAAWGAAGRIDLRFRDRLVVKP